MVSLVTTHCEVKHGDINTHQNQFLSKLKEKSAASLMSILLRWSLISTYCLLKHKASFYFPYVLLFAFSYELFGFWREHNQRANFSKHNFPFKCFQFNDTFIRRLARLCRRVCAQVHKTVQEPHWRVIIINRTREWRPGRSQTVKSA